MMTLTKPAARQTAVNALALASGIMSSFGVDQLPNVSETTDGFVPRRLTAFNASQFESNSPSEFLSNYAVRYTDKLVDSLIAVRQMLAPDIQAGSINSRFVQYAVYLLQDAFLALDNPIDDIRGIGADFPTLRNTTKVFNTQKIPNRGLALEVDEDEELLDADWQQRKVAYLRGILDRTALRRALALFVASATAVAQTWSYTGTPVDPDMNLINILESSYIRQNRMLLGPSASTIRRASYRAQNNPAGYQSGNFSDNDLANFLSLDTTMTVRNRYTSGAGATSTIFGNYVLLFLASDAMQKDDMSNLKTFWAPCNNGQRYATYVRQVGDKRWRIAVEKYELTAVTSTVGAEILTIS